MSKLKEKFNSMSIQTKTFFLLSMFCIAVVSVLWLLMVQYLPRIYEKQRKSRIYSVAAKTEAAFGVLSAEELGRFVRNLAVENDVCRQVLSPTGESICGACVNKSCKIHRMNYFEMLNMIIATQQSGGKIEGIYQKRFGFDAKLLVPNAKYEYDSEEAQSMVYSRRIVNAKEETVGYIFLNIQLSPVAATISTIRQILVIVSIIMIVLTVFLSAYISKIISKPLETISKNAKQLATGDYETVFDATGYSEVNELSETLNYTAGELGKVDSLRRDFIANVSHDLRTPLTLISGYAEIMRDIPGENNSENAQVIINESNRLSTLVNDVLDMSKIQSGAIPMKPEKMSLSDTLTETVHQLSELLKDEKYEFVSDIFDCEIVADKARIRQCIYNLLINAVNYTGDDKKIFVKTEDKENYIRISVTDTGDGIDESEADRIWDRYYKSEKNHKRAVTGSGIGLSIVKSIVKSHNGRCGAYNTADKGACFWIELPK